MTRYQLSLLLCLISSFLFAQTQINSSFPFQTDSNKKYSIVVPSGYSPASPSKVMLGLHPLNTNRWSGQTWCEYLVEFAESNNLLLVCPDGGSDGRIDDAIDTAFTSVLLDSVALWYEIDEEKVYAIGFSWGGRTTYTYGLNNTHRLHGFIPIGAAMNGLNIDNVAANAKDQPFYLIHGGNDNLGGNFSPYKELLEDQGAILNSKVLPGVGHTIDFANNMAILTEAYRWIDSVNCDTTSTTTGLQDLQNAVSFWSVFPNPVQQQEPLQITWQQVEQQPKAIAIYDVQGRLLHQDQLATTVVSPLQLRLPELKAGVYFLNISGQNGAQQSQRLILRD